MYQLKKLSPRHLAMIETLIANPTMTQAQLSEQFEISQAKICQAVNSPIFKEELTKRLKETWQGSVKIAQKTMIDLAKNGDYKASEYILNSNGYKPKEEIDLNNKVIKVTIDD